MGAILVIQPLQHGDALQILPALAGLRRLWPDQEVWVLGQGEYANLLRQSQFVEGVVGLDFQLSQATPQAVEIWAQAAMDVLPLRKWRGVVNLSQSAPAGRLADLIGAQWKAGMLVQRDGTQVLADDPTRLLFGAIQTRPFARIHLGDFYRLMLRVDRWVPEILFSPTRGEQSLVSELLRDRGWDGREPLLVFQLGGSTSNRLWPVESYARIGREVHAWGLRPVLIGPPEERALAQAYFQLAPEGVIDLVGCLPTDALPALFHKACAMVATDVGAAHIAAHCGCKVVGIYFSTAWVHETGPYGEDHWVWQVELPCAPCFDRTACVERRCARIVRPEDVLWTLTEAGLAPSSKKTRPPSSPLARLFRSRRTDLGLLRFEPVYPAGDTVQDRLAVAVSEAAWLVLTGTRSRNTGDWARDGGHRIAPELVASAEALRRIGCLARAAEQECRVILRMLRQKAQLGDVKRRNDRLRALDEQIASTAEDSLLLRGYLSTALRTLPGHTPTEMAQEAAHVYRRTAEIAELAVQKLLETCVASEGAAAEMGGKLLGARKHEEPAPQATT